VLLLLPEKGLNAYSVCCEEICNDFEDKAQV
jgi:hypothetical protein